MPLDVLPGVTIPLTRDEWIANRLKFYRFRQEDADVGPDSQPHLDACLLADQLVIMSENARRIGQRVPLSEAEMASLKQRAAELDGGTGRLDPYPALGASGSIVASTGTTGSHIYEHDEFKYNSIVYEVTRSETYQDGDPIPVRGKTTGPTTNLIAGTIVTWSAPRPGCYATAVVAEDQNGEGLIGGRDEETADEYRQRLSDAMANPAAQENDAYIRSLIEDSRAHGVSVQKGFTFPGLFAGGSLGFTCTLKPASPGASRRPSTVQLAEIANYVIGKLSTDAVFPIALSATTTVVSLEVDWDPAADGWANVLPWPYSPGAGAPATVQMVVGTVTDSTHFQIKVASGSTYTALGAPGSGTALALWDAVHGVFVRKTVASITGTGPWAITCDAANGASDVAYTPIPDQLVSPWSENLPDAVTEVLAYIGTMGPGEQVASPIGGGMRQARSPAPTPKLYPSDIDDRIQSRVDDVESVVSCDLLKADPSTPGVPGSPGTTGYILELEDLGIYAPA